jgi:hypothetical protein
MVFFIAKRYEILDYIQIFMEKFGFKTNKFCGLKTRQKNTKRAA